MMGFDLKYLVQQFSLSRLVWGAVILFAVIAGCNELFIVAGSVDVAVGCFCFAIAAWLISSRWGKREADIALFVFGAFSLYLLWSTPTLYIMGIVGAIFAIGGLITFLLDVFVADGDEEDYEAG